ncbi:MAG: MarR family transcriptional regulator [Bacteroidota bacterium]
MSTKIKTAEDQDNAYGFLIERTAKLIKQHFHQQLRKTGADITVDQWVILHELYKENGLNQYEIAIRTFKHPPTITRIIDHLYKRKFVVREMDTQDRRRFNILLTQQGRDKVENLLPVVMNFRKQGWSGLTEEDFKTLQRILEAVSSNLQR